MQGVIVDFDAATQEGVIEDETSARYTFDLTGWRGRGLPDTGIEVSFEVEQGRARQVFNLPAGQLKARGTKKAGQDQVSEPWYRKLF